jgi:hypothetical protein
MAKTFESEAEKAAYLADKLQKLTQEFTKKVQAVGKTVGQELTTDVSIQFLETTKEGS